MSELGESHLDEMPAGEEDLYRVNHAAADLQSNSDAKYIKRLGMKRYQDIYSTNDEPDTRFRGGLHELFSGTSSEDF